MKKILCFVAIILTFGACYAQREVHIGPSYQGNVVYVNGKASTFDTLLVNYWQPGPFTKVDPTQLKIVTDKTGYFHFTLPWYKQPSLMQIYVNNKGKKTKLSEHYYFENTDNIYLTITKGENVKTDFTGVGSEKFNVVNQLYTLCSDVWSNGIIKQGYSDFNFNNSNNLASELRLFTEFTRIVAKKKALLISNSGLNNKMKKLVSYEHGRIFSFWYTTMYYLYGSQVFKNDASARALIRKSFNENRGEFTYALDTLMNSCPSYLVALAYQETEAMAINSDSNRIALDTYISRLKLAYSGSLLDMLIFNLFMVDAGLRKELSFDDVSYGIQLKEAIPLVLNPGFRMRLNNKLKLSKGENLFEGVFKDIDGKILNTSALIGKVVFIDIWSLGCSWCSIFHKSFNKNIYPMLKDNKHFVYLSINADKKNERWISGLRSNLYTSADYINVTTGELGMNHPFLKNYSITSLPCILLIDNNNKIYSSSFKNEEDVKNKILEALGNGRGNSK